MTPGELDAMQIILNNEVIMRALRKHFDGVVEQQLPFVGGESDEVVGQKYRAYHVAKILVADAFSDLESLRHPTVSKNIDVRHV